MAKLEMANLAPAIEHYHTTYGNLPASSAAVAAAAALKNPLAPSIAGIDFTLARLSKALLRPRHWRVR